MRGVMGVGNNESINTLERVRKDFLIICIKPFQPLKAAIVMINVTTKVIILAKLVADVFSANGGRGIFIFRITTHTRLVTCR
jgi:hypothetical protein